jgi:putative drug exporter of the RND superfamily
LAVIVLLLTFGAVVAAGLPVVTGVIALVTGLSFIALVSRVVKVPTVAPTLAAMVGRASGSTTRSSS